MDIDDAVPSADFLAGHPEARAAVRQGLDGIGFDEAGCAARLGTGTLRNVVPRMTVRTRQGPKDRFPQDPTEPLDVAIAAFLFRETVRRDRAETALGGAALDALTACRVLSLDGPEIRANVLLFPCAGLLLATDGLEDDGVTNRVMPLFPESYDLGSLAVRAEVGAALDLCTGSGIHALLASRHAGTAWGVDVSARALAFARFNAALNAAENVELVHGDLYAPVEGRRFGLITANPPYNPEVASAAGENYHSGGESGEELLSAIVRRIPEFLEAGGHAQVITLFVHRQGDPLGPRIQGWLGEARESLDVLVTARPAAYRADILKGDGLTAGDRALHESWTCQGITGFSFGVLHARWTPAGRVPFFLEGPFGDGLRGPGNLDAAAALEALSAAAPSDRPGLVALAGRG